MAGDDGLLRTIHTAPWDLDVGCGSTGVYPDAIDRFLSNAASRPDHPAVVVNGTTVTYERLEERVRRLAAVFASLPGPSVAIALPQGVEAYAAMFAAGMAGRHYTPLNVSAPIAKLRRVVRVLQPDVIVAAAKLAAMLAEETLHAAVVDPASLPRVDLLQGPGRRHEIAYVIFTSGSTGTPKGVVISRRALDHYVEWIVTSCTVRPDDRMSQYANIAFDLSVLDIYGTLCSGATLYPVLGQGDRLWPARMIEREKITVWNSVPSVLSMMMQGRELSGARLGSVRLFTFCGEPLMPEHLQALFHACPNAEVQNTYGPTEATVSMTCLRMSSSNYRAACDVSVAIGQPIPGMGLHLAGGAHEDEGEIVITGPQLATRYWQEPEQTDRAFRTVTVDGKPVTGYFTGDWAQRRNGHLFFKDRVDFQVKVRGFRIELDEVTAALRDCGWPVACVFKRGDALAAVVEQSEGKHFDEAALRTALASRLEVHAIPELIRVIDQLPRSENDKLDRRLVKDWLEAALAGKS
jgi:D-alanine--poly(phosphoribitol) ligase subunit 1